MGAISVPFTNIQDNDQNFRGRGLGVREDNYQPTLSASNQSLSVKTMRSSSCVPGKKENSEASVTSFSVLTLIGVIFGGNKSAEREDTNDPAA